MQMEKLQIAVRFHCQISLVALQGICPAEYGYICFIINEGAYSSGSRQNISGCIQLWKSYKAILSDHKGRSPAVEWTF